MLCNAICNAHQLANSVPSSYLARHPAASQFSQIAMRYDMWVELIRGKCINFLAREDSVLTSTCILDLLGKHHVLYFTIHTCS